MLKSMTVFEAFYVVQKQTTDYGLHSLPSRYVGTVHQANSIQPENSGWVGR